MSTWLSATPEILLALAILTLPGLVLAVCLRFRPWDALALSVPLSLGALAFANELSVKAKIHWGLPVLAEATVALAIGCLVCAWLGAWFIARRGAATTGSTAGASWTINQHAIAAAVTLLAALAGAVAVARGIGTTHSLNQTFDGAFHVNSINAVAQHRLASPSFIGSLTNPGLSGGFYPPTFGAVGGLVVIYTGINPVDAANIVALAMAVLWPLTVSIAIRRIARPTLFGYSIAMVGTVTVGLFPALLLRFGTLWPNALSYLALAPALVVMLRLLGLDRDADDGDAQQGDRLPWWPSLVAAVIALAGLLFAHPGAAFLLLYLAMPLLLWLGWRRFVVEAAVGPGNKALRAIAVTVFIGLLFVGIVWGAYRVATIASVRHQYWPPVESWDQAVGQVLLLGSHLSAPNAAMAVLVLVGLWQALRSARGRYLIAGYLIIATLAVLSAAIETPSTMRWTGFWYNDPYRLFAALPVVVIPLIALGADALRAHTGEGIEGLLARGGLHWNARYLSVGVASGLAICLGILVLQGGLGTRKVSNVVAMSYGRAPHQMVNPAEAAMFRRLAKEIPPGTAIAGDPFTGEVLAGVLSGHPIIYETFGQPKIADRALVGLRFRDYRTDPAVCAAVKRLNIGVVVTGRHFFMENHNRRQWYRGFEKMASIPGLTLIDSGGGASAYRVGSCRS